MMDCDPAKEEYQCVKDIMDEMIKNICDQQASNSESRTHEKKENEESEVPLDSKQFVLTHQMDIHLTSEDDKVSQKKSSDCKYRDVLNSLFDMRATVDEDIGPYDDHLAGSVRRRANADYIPLSCPAKTSGDDILSDKDKSFLMFLDDMRSLTTDEKPCAMTEKHPAFHVLLGNQSRKENAESLPVSEQTSVSNMLTIQALVNSQESEHFNCVDTLDQGEEDFTNPETKVFPLLSGNDKTCSANTFQMRQSGSSYNEVHSLENYTKDFTASGREGAPEENDSERSSSLNLDKFVDNLPLYTGNMSDDSGQSQLLFPEESNQFCSLDQFVNRQLQSAYGATGEKATAKGITGNALEQTFPDLNAEITGVTLKSSTPNTASTSFTQDSLDFINKDNQVFSDQTAHPLVLNVESNVGTMELQRGNTSPIGKVCPTIKDCETGHVDQRESSARHHAESISTSDNELDCSSSTANIRLMPENDISQIEPEYLLVCELSVEQGQVSRPGDIIEFESGKCGHEAINKKCGATDITVAENILQNENHPDQTTPDSVFKEKTYILVENNSVSEVPVFKESLVADVEDDSVPEEPVFKESLVADIEDDSVPEEPVFKESLVADVEDDSVPEEPVFKESLVADIEDDSVPEEPVFKESLVAYVEDDSVPEVPVFKESLVADVEDDSVPEEPVFKESLVADVEDDSVPQEPVFKESLVAGVEDDSVPQEPVFKEKTESLVTGVENDSAPEVPVMPEQQNVGQVKTSQCQQEHILNTPTKDNTMIAKIPNSLVQKDFNLTENMKCIVQEESCLKQEWSDQVGDAEFQTRCNMQETMSGNVTQSSPQKNIRPQLSGGEDASKLITQKQRDPQLQQSVIIQQTMKATELNLHDSTAQYENPPCSTSSYAVALHHEERDQEIISHSSEQCPHFQSTAVHRVSDQQIPDRDHLVPDQTVVFQPKNYIVSEADESLYKAEGQLKEARLPTPTFKWKYRPSCDGDDEDLIAPVEESVLGNIQPMITGQCSRSRRVGLSRKQKVRRLHKNVN